MRLHSKRSTPRGDKLKGVEKGRRRAGGMLTPLSFSMGSQIMIIPSWQQAGEQKEADAPCLYAIHKADVILVWTSKNTHPMPNFEMIFHGLWQRSYANTVQGVNGEFNQPTVRPNDPWDQRKKILESRPHCCLHIDLTTSRTMHKGRTHLVLLEIDTSH